MLKVVVAGTALVAWGIWQLLKQSSTQDAEDTREDAIRKASERVNGDSVDDRHCVQLKGFQDTREDAIRKARERVNGDSVHDRHCVQLEGFQDAIRKARERVNGDSVHDRHCVQLKGFQDTREDAIRKARERVNGDSVHDRHCVKLEGFQVPSSSRGSLYKSPHLRSDQKTLKVLSYNVWCGDVKLRERMRAIGNLIQTHSPDLICFQEVTPEIYEIFENSNWKVAYSCSVSPERAHKRKYFSMQLSKVPANFHRKRIGISNKKRELCLAEVDDDRGRKLVFAASHLVSHGSHSDHPVEMYSRERVAQAKQALDLLKNYSNVVFGGDMNWDEEVDGSFPLPHGWVDAWKELRPGEDGWTFDTQANQMLSEHWPLQKRLDRFLCNLRGFSLSSIERIGTEAINGLSYSREKKSGKSVRVTILPVLPSDHYGLLLTISSSRRQM